MIAQGQDTKVRTDNVFALQNVHAGPPMRRGESAIIERHVNIVNFPVQALLQRADETRQIRNHGNQDSTRLEKPSKGREAFGGVFEMLRHTKRYAKIASSEQMIRRVHEIGMHNFPINPCPQQHYGSLFTTERAVVDSGNFKRMVTRKIGKPYRLSATKFNYALAVLSFQVFRKEQVKFVIGMIAQNIMLRLDGSRQIRF